MSIYADLKNFLTEQGADMDALCLEAQIVPRVKDEQGDILKFEPCAISLIIRDDHRSWLAVTRVDADHKKLDLNVEIQAEGEAHGLDPVNLYTILNDMALESCQDRLYYPCLRRNEPRGKEFAPVMLKVPFAPSLRSAELLDAYFDAIIDQDRERIDRLSYENFTQTPIFKKYPCEFELYRQLMQEFWDARSAGLDFNGYYNWFKRSEELFEGGVLKPSFAEQLNQTVTRWLKHDQERENILFLAKRNFHIHPRHIGVVEKFIDDMRAGKAEAETEGSETSPSP